VINRYSATCTYFYRICEMDGEMLMLVKVAHPPGYPLFTVLSKLAMVLIPVRSPAWRVNFLNAVFSSLASGFLQHTVLRCILVLSVLSRFL